MQIEGGQAAVLAAVRAVTGLLRSLMAKHQAEVDAPAGAACTCVGRCLHLPACLPACLQSKGMAPTMPFQPMAQGFNGAPPPGMVRHAPETHHAPCSSAPL